MGKHYDAITPELGTWIARQKMFFVATAPLSAVGHVNCSPKAGDTLRVLADRQVAYVDLTGSGIETIAHLQENGRIVLMFCAFDGAPKIVRLHGRGVVHYPGDSSFESLIGQFPAHPGARAIITIEVTRVSDSCGFAVPLMTFAGDRNALEKWAENKGSDGLASYRREKNQSSIDGLPGYRVEGER